LAELIERAVAIVGLGENIRQRDARRHVIGLGLEHLAVFFQGPGIVALRRQRFSQAETRRQDNPAIGVRFSRQRSMASFSRPF
jgi:hypothetical protein